ncbi:MAG: GNAT family N-acetyltransferase [Acidobacteriota bacterium]|nr:GNAT family N-acetyltransferase [Acidobacteriota bacterium]MDH3528601.1 GNAT family N-acetyltransferase [Acidobacteriota bacterium]
MRIQPTTLEGDFVRLEPLSEIHKPGLEAAIRDGELWKLNVTMVPHPDDLDAFIQRAADEQALGEGLVFATIEKAAGAVAGSTRFMHTDHANKRTEIGFTFLGKSWQRTRINTEAKLLMLTHAFEVLEMNRVEFLTDFLNDVSRTAIARLGAKQEGTLRRHMIMRDGRVRDSVVFSIIKDDWDAVKQDLTQKLKARITTD